MERPDLEISKLIGQPLNPQLPCAMELKAMADTFTAEPGDHVWRYQNVDLTADVILDVDANGLITPKKRTPLNDIELTFKGVNSKLEYVLVEDVLNKVDTNALGRRKEAISRGMDKREVKVILDALITPSNTYFPHNAVFNNEITPVSGEDLYDIVMKMKHAIEDYGDNYLLLVGSTVKEKIDTYDKDNAGTFNYNINLTSRFREVGIDVMKIFGKVSLNDAETEVSLLDAKKMILIARNSRVSEGKPIKFVRRRITPEIAQQMGVDVDEAQRAIMVNPVPVQDSGNRLAYGVYGYESTIFCVTNPYAIVYSDVSVII